jgi:hypothetical protein
MLFRTARCIAPSDPKNSSLMINVTRLPRFAENSARTMVYHGTGVRNPGPTMIAIGPLVGVQLASGDFNQ